MVLEEREEIRHAVRRPRVQGTVGHRGTVNCAGCGKPFVGPDYKVWAYNKDKNVYCGSVCLAEKSSRTMAATNRKHASARMQSNNPMAHTESRKKMTATLSRIGHKPMVRGGNGTGLSPCEKALAIATGLAPYIVSTHEGRRSGYPTHYKLDLADPGRMLTVEVDGASHRLLARQEQDSRKEGFLKNLGWTVLRFTNRQVLEDLPACIEAITRG